MRLISLLPFAARLAAGTAAAAEKVRYCRADSPACPLYDGTSGLPALPFEQGVAP